MLTTAPGCCARYVETSLSSTRTRAITPLCIKADLRLSLQAFLSIGGGIVNRRSGGVPSPKVLHCVYLSAAMAALQGMMLCEFLHMFASGIENKRSA